MSQLLVTALKMQRGALFVIKVVGLKYSDVRRPRCQVFGPEQDISTATDQLLTKVT